MKKWFIFITSLLLLSACSQPPHFDSPIYSGEALTIGIVGEPPNVREKSISFIPLSMEDVLKKNFQNVDAVLIHKRYLKEAAKPPYADIYLQSSVPFVFIESEKVYLAFVDRELSYEKAHQMKSGDYFIGFYKDTYFGVGLYNHIKNEKMIQDGYSRLFALLERAKHTGKIIVQ
ncbi:putative periplasmic lipoprotein [Anoxybacteroides rupiense]|uniref:hypothetical protein n=1 Tax=Anoxybacteroides rupiense TaxID=311460 RepID=UPI003672880A